jgi:hypothetical protein
MESGIMARNHRLIAECGPHLQMLKTFFQTGFKGGALKELLENQ